MSIRAVSKHTWTKTTAAVSAVLAAVLATVFASLPGADVGTSEGVDQKSFATEHVSLVPAAGHREWFVSPEAAAAGKGTLESPIELSTILDRKVSKVKPGDIVTLADGVYRGGFTSTIEGTTETPILIRGKGLSTVIEKPMAERTTATLTVRGSNVWFRDLVIANSHTNRERLDPDNELNPWRGSGINVYAPNTKYINLVIRDAGHGFGLWNEEGGTEIYGCVLFNNGNNKKEHGVYAHNRTGTQIIRDNIIFNGAGYGLHVYANSTKSSISGFEIDGNTIFNNGVLTLDDQVADQILVGGVDGVSAERIVLRNNYIYNHPSAPTAKNRGIRLGYEDMNNRDVGLFDNYVVSKVALKISGWSSVQGSGNTIVSTAKKSFSIENPDRAEKMKLAPPIYANPESGEPLPVKVFVRPNKFELGRANITIFNWQRMRTVAVDVSSVLKVGDRYEVIDVQNFSDLAVLAGVFDGKPLELPMGGSDVAKPVGSVERVPSHTDSRFGVFLIRKASRREP